MDAPATTAPALCPCCSQTIPEPFRCAACGGPFIKTRAGMVYCSKPCSTAWHRKLALGRDTSRPYLRRPRTAASLAASQAKKEQKQEDLMIEVAPVLPPADDTAIEALFAQIMAEVEADERADGLGEIDRPDPEATPRPFQAAPTLPSTDPTWSPPRRLGQHTSKVARLRAMGFLTA